MTVTLTTIRSYLIPPAGSYWKWSDNGEAIEWFDGRTIVFRKELAAILRRQVSVGLPPLGPVVLLLAACRDSWPESVKYIRSVNHVLRQFRVVDTQTQDAIDNRDSWAENAIADLTRIHNWPANLRGNVQAKAELIATVFEIVSRQSNNEEADEIVATLNDGISQELLETAPKPKARTKQLLEDLHILSEGLRGVDADQLRLRLDTGLEQHIVPAETEEPLAKRIRSLFSRLQNDEKLAGMVRLARDLMAIVHLPRPLDHHDDMPVGGVSDISNRGTLDRLLLSELAQDDDTLMMRVAMNEAMYLRRETPPRNPPRSRTIVLDAGLRMWGVPRVFATSVALSLAAMNDPSVDLHVLRPDGNRLLPVDVATREGLVEHLKQLLPESHPGRALPELLHCLDDDRECESDTILITTDDVLSDRDFQRALADCETEIAFVITVSRDGCFRMMQRTMHGTKLLKEATLDLKKLLEEPRRPAVPLIDSQRATDLPAICRLKQFPLRLSHHVNPKHTWWLKNRGVLSIVNDRRLMHWEKPFWGGRQIIEQLPSRQLLWCSATPYDDGWYPFVVGNLGTAELMLMQVDLETADYDYRTIDATETPVLGVCSHAGVLFIVHRREVDVCDRKTGHRLHTAAIPRHTSWVRDRFFRSAQSWQALSYDGLSPRFEEVVNYAQYADYWQLATMFDVDGIQGPVAISSKDGSIYYSAEKKKRCQQFLTPPIQILAISRNGSRVAARHNQPQPVYHRNVIVDTRNGGMSPFYGDPYRAVESSFHQVIRPRNYRNWFSAVGLHRGRLMLQGRERLMRFDCVVNPGFSLSPTGELDRHTQMIPFVDHAAKRASTKHGLKVATFKDGSKIFLDSRGLLHLKSADRNIPEVTFVLSDTPGDIACWCANGKMSGPSYYLGNHDSVAPSEIWKDAVTPFLYNLP